MRSPNARLLLNVVADTELFDESTILKDVVLLDVGQKTTTLTNEHQKTTAGVEILLVRLHVLGKALDALSENSNLNLGIAGVDRGITKLGGKLCLALFRNSHCFTFHLGSLYEPYIRPGLGSRW